MHLRLLAILFALVLTGCGPRLQRFEYTRLTMGVEARIVMYAPGKSHADHAANAAYARLAQLDAVMSDYRQDSELMQLCRAPVGEPVAVSDDLFNVIALAQRITHASGGAFDITIGPLVGLWREARRTHQLPSAQARAKARQRVGAQHIQLDPHAQTVTIQLSAVQLDLGGIGKGYAAQEAIETLRDHDITRALIALAGDIVVSNAPPGQDGWRITIDHGTGERTRALSSDEVADISPSLEGGGQGAGGRLNGKSALCTCLTPHPPPCPLPQREGEFEARSLSLDDRKPHTLILTNAAVSTSGSNQQFITINGTRYSHIIDPRTGLGLTAPTIATVIARGPNSGGGALADALSSAVCVLGPGAGAALVEQFPGCTLITSP